MADHESMTAGMRVEYIVNPATGQHVKISEGTAKAILLAPNHEAFISGYQARLADEWQEQRAKPRQYTVRLRGSEPVESFIASSHSDQGEWIVFYGTDGETLAVIKQADIISIWRRPTEAS